RVVAKGCCKVGLRLLDIVERRRAVTGVIVLVVLQHDDRPVHVQPREAKVLIARNAARVTSHAVVMCLKVLDRVLELIARVAERSYRFETEAAVIVGVALQHVDGVIEIRPDKGQVLSTRMLSAHEVYEIRIFGAYAGRNRSILRIAIEVQSLR